MPSVIVANGDLGDLKIAGRWCNQAELLIAVDGGLAHCLEMDREPDLLIGDLDSVKPEQLERLERAGTEVTRHPRRKDATDLELALLEAHTRGAQEAVVLGAIGSRWDQSIANLLLGANATWSEMRVRFISGPQEAEVVRPGRILEIKGAPGDQVSLIPLGGDAHGITTEGLAYQLDGGSLTFAATRGVSNYIEYSPATVRLDEGILLCLTIHGGPSSVENASD